MEERNKKFYPGEEKKQEAFIELDTMCFFCQQKTKIKLNLFSNRISQRCESCNRQITQNFINAMILKTFGDLSSKIAGVQEQVNQKKSNILEA